MSVSRHPIALRLERLGGDHTSLLAMVMALPLVDGIFPALVLAGALSSPVGVLEVGLLVFGGSATLAVVLAEMDVPPREAARAVLVVGAILVVGAGVEAALAPTIASVVDLPTFERFAALVIAAIAAKTASARVGEYLPRPGVIVGLGLVASVDPSGATLQVTTDLALVGRAVAAALVGTLFALGAAVFGPRLRQNVDIDRFRFGSAVALGLLTLSVLGFSFQGAPLAVVAVTGLLAFNPDGVERARESESETGMDPASAVANGGPAADDDDGSAGPGAAAADAFEAGDSVEKRATDRDDARVAEAATGDGDADGSASDREARPNGTPASTDLDAPWL